MQKWMKCRTDSAVSPVVGVLLMLVVTIIIAAVVSGFAGGLVSTTQKAPAANIGMELNTQANNGMGGFTKTFTFTHKSGDVLNTKDLSIITYFVATNGTIVKHHKINEPIPEGWFKGWTQIQRDKISKTLLGKNKIEVTI